MRLVVSIDTEEDNRGRDGTAGYTVENIHHLPRLQALFDEFGVTPTYLVTYPVARHRTSAAILRKLQETGSCEIGAQCHPWNTPPLEEVTSRRNSMLCNLRADVQHSKVTMLHEAIYEAFGQEPRCFRAGRWGFGPEIAAVLQKLGYRVDSSMTPYIDWRHIGGADFSAVTPRPFFLGRTARAGTGAVLEVPPTIGYVGLLKSSTAHRVVEHVRRTGMDRFGVIGILDRIGLVDSVWLSPEVTELKAMIRLVRRMRQERYDLVHLVFHSPSLQPGLTPFVRNEADCQRFWSTIRKFLQFAVEGGLQSVRLGEVSQP